VLVNKVYGDRLQQFEQPERLAAFVELVERVRTDSLEFARWWNAHDIRGSAAGQKLLVHPERGTQRYECATFQANDDLALKLAIYTPV